MEEEKICNPKEKLEVGTGSAYELGKGIGRRFFPTCDWSICSLATVLLHPCFVGDFNAVHTVAFSRSYL